MKKQRNELADAWGRRSGQREQRGAEAGPELAGQSRGPPGGPAWGQGGRGRGVREPPAGLTDTAGTAAFTLREMQAGGQLSAGRPFQAESDVTSRLTGLGHRVRRELPAWGATLETLRQAGVPRRNPGERGRPATAATERVRRDCFWMCFESKDNRKIIYCYSGSSKVNLDFKVLAPRSTVLLRGTRG